MVSIFPAFVGTFPILRTNFHHPGSASASKACTILAIGSGMTMNKCTVFLPSLVSILHGCGGGSNPDRGGQTTLAPLVPGGNPVLYVHSTLQVGGGSDQVVRTVRQVVPATGESIVIDVDDSFSFSRSSTSIKNFDDIAVLLRNSGTSGGFGGTWSFLDIDAQVDKSLDQQFQPTSNVVNTS